MLAQTVDLHMDEADTVSTPWEIVSSRLGVLTNNSNPKGQLLCEIDNDRSELKGKVTETHVVLAQRLGVANFVLPGMRPLGSCVVYRPSFAVRKVGWRRTQATIVWEDFQLVLFVEPASWDTGTQSLLMDRSDDEGLLATKCSPLLDAMQCALLTATTK
jgi:hypothetical protein